MKKTICITGASSGIGEACARELADKGHLLILGARRVDKMQELARLGNIHCASLDVTDDASVRSFVHFAMEAAHGKIDVLINNAGMALGVAPIAEGALEEWQRVIDVNVTGVLRVTRAFLPKMIEHRDGLLLFLSSIAAHQVYPGGGVYCATKHAIRALAATLKLELNGTGIRVSTLDPGMVNTEFSTVRHHGNKQKADATYHGMTPLTPEDIAACATFVIERPAHVNIDQMIIMPTDQATVYKVHRT